jgi:hypothetical protein
MAVDFILEKLGGYSEYHSQLKPFLPFLYAFFFCKELDRQRRRGFIYFFILKSI